jgi:hypothetical protein
MSWPPDSNFGPAVVDRERTRSGVCRGGQPGDPLDKVIKLVPFQDTSWCRPRCGWRHRGSLLLRRNDIKRLDAGRIQLGPALGRSSPALP